MHAGRDCVVDDEHAMTKRGGSRCTDCRCREEGTPVDTRRNNDDVSETMTSVKILGSRGSGLSDRPTAADSHPP